MHEHQNDLLAQGLARWYRGRLIPVIRGGSGEDEGDDGAPVFAAIPSLHDSTGAFRSFDFDNIDDDQLQGLIEEYDATIAQITEAPADFVTAEFTTAQLLDETKAAIEAVKALKAEAAARVEPVELTDDERAAFAELASFADDGEGDDGAGDGDGEGGGDGDGDGDGAGDGAGDGDGDLTAAAKPPRGPMPRRSSGRDREPVERDREDRPVAIVAAGGVPDATPGTRFTSELDIADAMISRHKTFGDSGPDVVEKFKIARADWSEDYPADRRLDQNIESNFEIVNRVIDPAKIKASLRDRMRDQDKDLSLVASGGLCAPVTPYYNLQYISVPQRPVQGALPSFNAERGGLRYARPAALSAASASDAIGIITAAEDHAGGSSATKTCQVIPCPDFQETDVDIIYHCLQFGNLGARVFPELVAQWNNLVLAAHARLAESNLLTGIDAFSTQVTAGALGLGASATLLSQILAAANGLRSRNRMDPEAVLRLMLPWWAVDLIVSDVIRSQFQRFDTDRQRVIALLRSFNIEPTFYIDSANGRGQVFGTQADGALLPFPEDVVWYLYPEGSFLYLDTGTLELGIVRDSVLNATNDFQIFGETFENVAYVGVEALAVSTAVCDSGTVSLPHAVTCPIDYSAS